MSSETNIFNFLLELEDIYSLYSRLGDTIKNDFDVANLSYNSKALSNTINLLKTLKLIECRENEFDKCGGDYSIAGFSRALNDGIYNYFYDELKTILNCKKHYDEEKAMFYIDKNDIPLKYMGLLMLLEQLGELEKYSEREYVTNIHKYIENTNERIIGVEELKKRIEIQEKLGLEAEVAVLEYERRKLQIMNIAKEPKWISSIDVTAGYDILSYLFEDCIPNKYIEVKSVDNSCAFFISRNEVEVARRKKEAYFLYLYNRCTKEVYEIRDPYSKIFCEEGDWRYEPESYKISRIISG